MKGWVYIISNPAMPGLIKVGHSTKDPELRAQELNNTGSPHPYVVEYEMLIEEPFRVEQQGHKALASFREGKEWFRCSSEEAIAVIQHIAEGRAINETFKRVDREQAEKLRKEREEAESRQRLVEARVAKQQEDVRSKYEEILSSHFTKYPFWAYWLGCSIGVLILIAVFSPKTSDTNAIWLSAIGGAVVAALAKNSFESMQKQSSKYKALIQEKESKLEEARTGITFFCTSCRQVLRSEVKQLLSSGNTAWNCPKCKTRVNPLQV